MIVHGPLQMVATLSEDSEQYYVILHLFVTREKCMYWTLVLARDLMDDGTKRINQFLLPENCGAHTSDLSANVWEYLMDFKEASGHRHASDSKEIWKTKCVNGNQVLWPSAFWELMLAMNLQVSWDPSATFAPLSLSPSSVHLQNFVRDGLTLLVSTSTTMLLSTIKIKVCLYPFKLSEELLVPGTARGTVSFGALKNTATVFLPQISMFLQHKLSDVFFCDCLSMIPATWCAKEHEQLLTPGAIWCHLFIFSKLNIQFFAAVLVTPFMRHPRASSLWLLLFKGSTADANFAPGVTLLREKMASYHRLGGKPILKKGGMSDNQYDYRLATWAMGRGNGLTGLVVQ